MLAQLSRRSVVALVVIALVALVGCQYTPMEPMGEADGNSVQLLKANTAVFGLAKGELGTTIEVNADEGGVLGGSDLYGNYVEFPANALKQDLEISFKIFVNEDGVLVFSVHSDEVPSITFKDGLKATMAVNKDWLAGQPNVAFYMDSENETYSVDDGGDVWLVELPHFTNYAWAIAD